jgi:hypothetical protein
MRVVVVPQVLNQGAHIRMGIQWATAPAVQAREMPVSMVIEQ